MLRIIPLKEAKSMAEKANAYAHSQIKKGYTDITQGYTELKTSDPHFDFIREGVETVRVLDDDLQLQEKIRAQPLKPPFLVFYESVIANSSKYSLGNCYELALQALDYILNNPPHIHAEVFKIKKSDHAILVLNREPGTDPADPEAWGKNAVICDPLANKIFIASDYIKKNPKLFKGPQNVLQPLSNHNVSSLVKMRNIVDLKMDFEKEARRLEKIFDQCQMLLKLEEDLAKKNYGATHQKTLMIRAKISKNLVQIAFVQGMIDNYLTKIYQDPETAKRELSEGIDVLKDMIEKGSQFSKTQLGIFAHKENNFTDQVMSILGMKSSTEYHLDEIKNLISAQVKKK